MACRNGLAVQVRRLKNVKMETGVIFPCRTFCLVAGDRYVSLGFRFRPNIQLHPSERERDADELVVEPDTVVEEGSSRDLSDDDDDENDVIHGTHTSRIEPMDTAPAHGATLYHSFTTHDRTGFVPSSMRSDPTQEEHVDHDDIVSTDNCNAVPPNAPVVPVGSEGQESDMVDVEREVNVLNAQMDTSQKDETIKRLKRKCDVLEGLCRDFSSEDHRKRSNGFHDFHLDDVPPKSSHVLYVRQPNCPVQEELGEKEDGECEQDPDFQTNVNVTFSDLPAWTRKW